MRQFLLATTFLVAFGASDAYAAPCATAAGSGDGSSLIQFYVGDCSSDNQANDGDDGKEFITKNTTGVTSVNGSLDKNSSAVIDQNFLTKVIGGGSFTTFTDGNGFANIKSVGDITQEFEIDPVLPSDFDGLKHIFKGFDGLLFRGQEVDLPGAIEPGGADTGSITITVNFEGGKQATKTISGIKLKADFGVLGFDEPTEPGALVDSVLIQTDALHAFDQVKQFEFSVPGVAVVPEPQTWLMGMIGFGLMAALGWRRRLKAPRWAL